MTIFVGSTNPVKVGAVEHAVSSWSNCQVTGFEVKSGVSAQPMSDDETKLGARNRAQRALEKGLVTSGRADQVLGVGLEGGCFQWGDQLWSTVWAAVTDQQGRYWESNGGRFLIPSQMAEPILAGGEMGLVIGKLKLDPELKKKQGAIGVVTNNMVTRTEEYAGIVKLALGLWYGRNWYTDLTQSSTNE